MKSPEINTAPSSEQSRYALEDQAKMTAAENYFVWQNRMVTPELGRRVVEVGCGIGNFTRFLLDREAVYALDFDPSCVKGLQARYPDQPNLHIQISEPGHPTFAQLSRFQPDSCVCLNVLEHIEDDLGALRSMADILIPGGVIVLWVPAFLSLYGPIDKNLCHFRRYTRRSMLQLATAAGLQVRKLHYLNCIGFFGWWANARIFGREEQSPLQIRTFDRFVVPWLSQLEKHVHPPFGQSVFAVLRKP
jgi:SAM-dependent methyltransferase